MPAERGKIEAEVRASPIGGNPWARGPIPPARAKRVKQKLPGRVPKSGPTISNSAKPHPLDESDPTNGVEPLEHEEMVWGLGSHSLMAHHPRGTAELTPDEEKYSRLSDDFQPR